MKENAVSNSGSPTTRNGTANEMTAYHLKRPMIETVASTYPRRSAPVSPINIFAGLRLYGRKPMQEPASAAVMMATLISATTSAIMSIVKDEMVEMPAASPSRPSIRLTEFVMATIHSTVSGTDQPFRIMYSDALKILMFDKTSTTTPW